MKKDQIRVGGTYLAKVTDKVVPVRLDAENPRGGWDATNLATNKKVRIKSAQRLRGPAPERAAARGTQEPASAAPADAERVPLAEAMRPTQAGNAKRGRAAKEPKEAKEKKPSGLDAAAQVLKDAGEPMRCGDMVEKMLSTGLWKTGGKTPAATIYSAILREITTKGTAYRFKKTDRGLFTVNAR